MLDPTCPIVPCPPTPHLFPAHPPTQRASLEARQQDIRDKQAAVQQSAEHVEKLKVGTSGSTECRTCWQHGIVTTAQHAVATTTQHAAQHAVVKGLRSVTALSAL